MWRFHDSQNSFRFGFCIGSTDTSGGFAEFFYFLVQVCIGDSDLRGERLIAAEFQELRNIDCSWRVKEQPHHLDNITGIMLKQCAANVAQILSGWSPLGAGIHEHFDAFESVGFFFRLGVAAPGRLVLAAM